MCSSRPKISVSVLSLESVPIGSLWLRRKSCLVQSVENSLPKCPMVGGESKRVWICVPYGPCHEQPASLPPTVCSGAPAEAFSPRPAGALPAPLRVRGKAGGLAGTEDEKQNQPPCLPQPPTRRLRRLRRRKAAEPQSRTKSRLSCTAGLAGLRPAPRTEPGPEPPRPPTSAVAAPPPDRHACVEADMPGGVGLRPAAVVHRHMHAV